MSLVMMDERQGRLLAGIIGVVGSPHFVADASHAICDFSDFELSSVVLHRDHVGPKLLFENLVSVGSRTGIENYIRFTYRANPMLANKPVAHGVCRASDFRSEERAARPGLRDYLVHAPEEELGFRTVGWPPGLEELGLYFGACGGVVELSLYRSRGRRSASAHTLQSLRALRVPLAAAFDRHAALGGGGRREIPPLSSHLSPRENEVAQLLLAGCSTEAISLRLGISGYTVKDHRKKIFRKLHVGSLAELFALSSTIF